LKVDELENKTNERLMMEFVWILGGWVGDFRRIRQQIQVAKIATSGVL
jgi:hypothetical protein